MQSAVSVRHPNVFFIGFRHRFVELTQLDFNQKIKSEKGKPFIIDFPLRKCLKRLLRDFDLKS